MLGWLHGRDPTEITLIPGQKFGERYELIEKIGEGGMGVVWKALQISLDRPVALKMIRPALISETGLARFNNEAKLAANLKHPGIVPVHEFGEQDGCYYICMDFIAGETLARRLESDALDPKTAAAIVYDVANAIQYAHARDVIHRDLKPANILLDAEQAGRPRVADFGLARRVSVAEGITVVGNILGTPGYMSPEQASGQTGLVNKPTDIFSLGAVLYHALTGRPPFSVVNWLEVCQAALLAPRSIEEDIPLELEAICVACLAKSPNDRLTAEELATRLAEFLEAAPSETRRSLLETTATYVPCYPASACGNHVVICGLGDLGLRLALEGRSRGRSIIAIEQHWDSDALEAARSNGVAVIDGDATDEAVLRQARVEEAEFVVAACREDSANVAIAARIATVLPPTLKRREPLVCRLLITDYELRRLLSNESLFPAAGGGGRAEVRSKYRINFGDLNLHDTAARQCLRIHNLDFETIRSEDQTTVHVIVVGFGPMGQCLAIQAARIGHFANAAANDRRPRITVLDRTEIGFRRFREELPPIGAICDLHFCQADWGLGLANDLDRLSAKSAERSELATYVIALEDEKGSDDRENLKIGMKLSSMTAKRSAQILIYQSTRRGFASLFPNQGRGAALSSKLHAFGMTEDIFNWDVILHESEDRLARALHEDFQQHRRSEKASASENPDWNDLEEDVKESNRHAADHIPIKVRALGYHVDLIRSEVPPIQRFTEEETSLLARMEHSRWCAERRLAGWRQGREKDLHGRESPCLVPWTELAPHEKQKNYEQIVAIPRVLASIGQGIYQ